MATRKLESFNYLSDLRAVAVALIDLLLNTAPVWDRVHTQGRKKVKVAYIGLDSTQRKALAELPGERDTPYVFDYSWGRTNPDLHILAFKYQSPSGNAAQARQPLDVVSWWDASVGFVQADKLIEWIEGHTNDGRLGMASRTVKRKKLKLTYNAIGTIALVYQAANQRYPRWLTEWAEKGEEREGLATESQEEDRS